MRREGFLAVAVAAALLAGAARAPGLTIETLSARPAMVSGEDVLVRVSGKDLRGLRLELDGRDVTAALRPVAGATPSMAGLLTGLRPGRNRLLARAGAGEGALILIDWPVEGPIFSGPRQTPFVCQTEAFRLPDGTTMGPSSAPACSAPTQVQWMYKPRGAGGLKPLADPLRLPGDLDETTTVEGVRAPFLVRVETGVIDRSIYQFAVLADPMRPIDPLGPQPAWNRRLIALHGSGCTGGWYVQGPALGAEVMDVQRLSEGYALFASTLNHPANSCNAVLAAEVTMMVKERVVETLGLPLYTLSIGSSGGAYTSLQVADAYPGLIDGVLIGSVFPDALAIATTGLDGHLLTHYFAKTAPGRFTPAQQQAVGGYGAPAGLLANANQAARADPVADRKDVAGYASARFSPAVPEALRYDPARWPKGARPTMFDAAANIYGRDPATGFARRPFDNVGVQYGLAALNAGVIDKGQFLDLNAAVGGYDADADYVAARSRGDPAAIAAAYRSGLMLSGGGGLSAIPVFDFGGLYTDLDPAGEYHMRFHHFSVRERIAAWNGGTARNMATWGGGVTLAARRPGADPAEAALMRVQAQESFRLMQDWMTAVARDPAPASAQKAQRLRPSGLVDGCWTKAAQPRFIAEFQAYPDGGRCGALFPAHAFPRKVAGGPLANDVLKCALKPPDRRDYAAPFTAAEWRRLRAIFPAGVCDWSKPGAGRARVETWRMYGGASPPT